MTKVGGEGENLKETGVVTKGIKVTRGLRNVLGYRVRGQQLKTSGSGSHDSSPRASKQVHQSEWLNLFFFLGFFIFLALAVYFW